MRTFCHALALACLFVALSQGAVAAEPAWRAPWEKTLVDWLKTLTKADVAIEQKPYSLDRLDPAELQRNFHLASGYAPPLWFATNALKLADETFLWKHVWRDQLPVEQPGLQPYGITSGQMWVPSHPTTACHLAWLYGWERPWNPYHGDPHVARRAAVIGIVDLIMRHEELHYDGSGEAGCRQPPRSPHTGNLGFSLTFNVYTLSQVKDALPPPVRQAWCEGLRGFAETLGNARPLGPENMQLSTPVGIYYSYLATGEPELKRLAEENTQHLLARVYSPAGYVRDGGVPDGSYNGISLHRLAEYWAITRSDAVLKAIADSYQLKSYLTLVEPDGSWLSPSHFNARCPDGSR